MKKIVWSAVFLILTTTVVVQAADNMKAFPLAEQAKVRFVLHLPEQKDESLFKVELIVGKNVRVDKENRYFFGGRIVAQTIVGWGYTRYTVSELGPMGGTLMTVDSSAPKIDRFVTLGGEPYLIRYNSRLPVVVYVPEGAEVRYRIWSAGTGMKIMEKG
ncbi:MAG: proteinase inhibitor I4 serpin [Gammaproteobacteria bacterium]|nr:proteinase inhibitor I4 serpin [Gammaproteobacteria bacterium]